MGPAESSSPTIGQYDPKILPYHYDVIKAVRTEFDYSKGTHEVLLSGSVGSGKSTLLSHIILTHCLLNAGARVLIGRLSMPALRSTIFAKILEHLGGDYVEGRDFFLNLTTASIKFKNGSEIVSRSWSDKRYFKFRSLELSGAAIEEIIETDTQDFYNEIKMRVGRLPHIKENIIIAATNPGSPSTWQYKYFIESKSPTRHVYYSRTEHNPFLPPQYIEQLKNDLDPKMARRMLEGVWLEISSEVVYHAFDEGRNYRATDYTPDPRHSVYISWDFNIGEGKPLSVVLFQFIDGHMHIFAEVVVHGMRTEDSCDELFERGLVELPTKYILTGDASGKHRDTRSKRSDYEIIERHFANTRTKLGRPIEFEMRVPLSNPAVRSRHNMVNAHCLNESGKVRLTVYKGAPTALKGLKLTQLKKGGNYIEDDSKEYQHISTAIGYGLAVAYRTINRTPQHSVRL